jgi:membrane-bound metal-dependent hydrolase YbcI (DUF457 family)
MSPISHGMSDLLVGVCALEISPELADLTGKGWFIALSIFAGQIPDLDCAFGFIGKKIRGSSMLLRHRGIGHSFLAQIAFASFFAMLLVGDTQSVNYFTGFLYFFTQIAFHLLGDMIDGSKGIYYLAPMYNKPLRLFSLMENVDDAILNWCPNTSSQRILKRAKAEMIVNFL